VRLKLTDAHPKHSSKNAESDIGVAEHAQTARHATDNQRQIVQRQRINPFEVSHDASQDPADGICNSCKVRVA
jgi:hypothetical protein